MQLIYRLVFLFSLINLVSCGASYEDKDVKKYRLYLQTDNDEAQDEFRSLIDYYNDQAGLHVLTYSDNKADANSYVKLTSGLQERDGKVGWGQWIKDSKQGNALLNTPGKTVERVNTFSMRLEFDKEYFESRMGSQEESKRIDLYKLFTHEVGHGLQMNHVNDINDVMYPDISGEKNFNHYFENVRSYMN